MTCPLSLCRPPYSNRLHNPCSPATHKPFKLFTALHPATSSNFRAEEKEKKNPQAHHTAQPESRLRLPQRQPTFGFLEGSCDGGKLRALLLPTMTLFILTETSAGYALLKAKDKKLLKRDDLDIPAEASTPEGVSNLYVYQFLFILCDFFSEVSIERIAPSKK